MKRIDDIQKVKYQGDASLIGGPIVLEKIEAIIKHWGENEALYDISSIKRIKKAFKDHGGITPTMYETVNQTIEYHNINLESDGNTTSK